MTGATASIMIVDDHPVIGESMAMALRAHEETSAAVLRSEGLYLVAWPPGSEWRNRRNHGTGS